MNATGTWGGSGWDEVALDAGSITLGIAPAIVATGTARGPDAGRSTSSARGIDAGRSTGRQPDAPGTPTA